MKPTMLVSGGDTPLGNSIIQQALERFNVATTTTSISPGKGSGRSKPAKQRQEAESLVLVPWSRRSPVSARNVMLRTVASFETIDCAVVVHNLTNEKRPLHDLPLNVIEEITDIQLKSHLFMVKEIMAYFLAHRSGTLALVIDRSGHEELSTMDALITDGFAALANGTMASYRSEPISISAFESSSNDATGYASFILSTLDDPDRDGQWFRFGEKSGLFRGGRRSRPRRS